MPERSYLAELVRINDALIWSHDRPDSLVAAVDIVRELTGARIAPTYLLNHTGELLVLATDAETRAYLGEYWATLPAYEHLRDPWLNPDEWPVSAAEHLGEEGWTSLPEDFRAWFGESGVVVSIHADGRHLGAVLLCFDGPWELTQTRTEFLAAVGRILGNAVYRWQVAGRERELGALEERRRLGEELHVDLSQQVAALGMLAGVMELDLAAGDTAALTADVARLRAQTTGLTSSLRHQMLGLRRDAELARGGLVGRVREHIADFERQFGIPATLECDDDCERTDVPLGVAAQIVRVLQEALANVHLHAQASHVTIRLLASSARIRLEVTDDGNGFDPRSVPDSRLGVRIMTERMQQVDGVLQLGRATGGGTRVVAEAPLRHPASRPLPADVTP